MKTFSILNENLAVIGRIDAQSAQQAIVAWNKSHESDEAAGAVAAEPASCFDSSEHVVIV